MTFCVLHMCEAGIALLLVSNAVAACGKWSRCKNEAKYCFEEANCQHYQANSGCLQVRAGTGGDEAALFAGDLLRMYERAAALNGWRFEVSNSLCSCYPL